MTPRVHCGAGVTDVDPPFAWNCQVVAGAGVVEDVQQLYSDIHSYLAGQLLSRTLWMVLVPSMIGMDEHIQTLISSGRGKVQTILHL